jgi:hypothetical protein
VQYFNLQDSTCIGCAMAQAVSHQPLTSEARSVHVGFVVDKVALGHIFLLSSSVFPVNHSTMALHTHISPGG